MSAQLFCVRSKTKGEMRLDDNETRISGARRAEVTGEELALPKPLKSCNFTLAKAAMRWMSVRWLFYKAPSRV
jgi:hypothetical protein